MKYLILFTFLTCASLPASAQDNPLAAKVEQLLQASGGKQNFTAAVTQMIDVMRQNPTYQGQLPDQFWTEFEREIKADAFDKIKPKLVEVYLKNYTEEELDYQIDFYTSDMGQAIVKKQPAVLRESMLVGQEWGRELGEMIGRRLQEELEKQD